MEIPICQKVEKLIKSTLQLKIILKDGKSNLKFEYLNTKVENSNFKGGKIHFKFGSSVMKIGNSKIKIGVLKENQSPEALTGVDFIDYYLF